MVWQFVARRRLHWVLGVICACAFALWLEAGVASAILVKLPHGGYASYDAMSGAKAPKAARIFDAAFTNLDYSGGPVMPSNANYTIIWQPANYGSHTAFQSGYTSGVNTFFTDMAADSGQTTNSDAVSTQYNDSTGHTAAYSFQNGGSLTDTNPLPPNGCPAATGDICITDAQIQTELNNFLSAHALAHDLAHEYYLLTPPDVASCFDSAGTSCSGNADQSQQFCAYHSQTSAGYVYSNIPDLAGLYGCDPYVTGCPWWASSCSYNNGPADGVLSAISHEHNESITDPQPNNAWTDWGSSVGGEIGDKCNNDAWNDPNLNTQDDGFGDLTPYNETIGSRNYLVQREWSNQTAGCLDSFSPNGTLAHASFTSSAGSGNAVNFNAGASSATGGVAEYVWQFNDGPGQTGTIETKNATIGHTFPSGGTYTVALTVMASDGTSQGTAQIVNVGSASPPTAAFSSAPSSALVGSSISFDGRASSDPNSGGAITSYAWNFGDGATGTGATVSHAYSHPGTFTVQLTVTDNSGLTNATSHTVSISSPSAPTAAFVAPAGGESVPLLFDGRGSRDPNPGGAITGYSWNFGDGTTGSGAATAHAFHAGLYNVTLTVSDNYGQTASVSHLVAVSDDGPSAAFTAPSAIAGSPAAFHGSGSDPDGYIAAYSWNFGDGSSGSGQSPSHTYARAGSYTVTLTVVDSSGQLAVVSHQVPVTGGAVFCLTPKLSGKTLGQAKRALAAAHCRLGKAKAPHKPKHPAGRHKKWVLLVSSSTPPAGRRLASGTSVSVKLVYKAVRK